MKTSDFPSVREARLTVEKHMERYKKLMGIKKGKQEGGEMITWAERAKAAISQTGQGGTAKTDETPISRLLAVSAVATEAVSAKPERLSTVLAVPSPAVLEKCDFSIAVTDHD